MKLDRAGQGRSFAERCDAAKCLAPDHTAKLTSHVAHQKGSAPTQNQHNLCRRGRSTRGQHGQNDIPRHQMARLLK
jgi:hypothetical protein